MRAVVKVKQSQGRGPSNAARYIAESKLDPEREGKRARLLSSSNADDITYGEANRYLKDGTGKPAKGDLIHFSVSFLNEDFERLGPNDQERKERLREVAREAMDELRSDLRVQDWRWAAGIHLNTAHPHIHFLIYKEIIDERGKERRLGKIPRSLLPHTERNLDASRPVEGKLGEHFVAALDRAQERAREADRQREEAGVRATTERLEEGPGAERAHRSSKVPSEPGPRDVPETNQTGGHAHAITIANRKHFKGTGADNEVYIGRAMARIKGRVLGNPYRIGRDGAREEVIEKYDRELQWKILEQGEGYREGSINLHRERGGPDMTQILSYSLEFDKPLVHQDIEYRTIDNFVNAMKTSDEDKATRRKIAAATPDEARRLGAQLRMRPDWQEIRLEVVEKALRHKFAPGTNWRAKLMATGAQEIIDGSKNNLLGQLLMDIREETRDRRPRTFLDRLNDETRASVTRKVIPAIDQLMKSGKPRWEIFTEVDKQVYRRHLPVDEKERNRQINERIRINDFLKAHVDLWLHSDDRLLELAERNLSPAGRELTRELILRGPRQEFGAEPDLRGDMREAFRDRRLGETGYETQYSKASWLSRYSRELRDMHERGAVIKEDILVLPAEPHELNGVVNDRKPFMNELSYAHKRIRDSRKAVEFYTLGKAIAGRTANAKTEIAFFKYYYGLISREKGDDQGRLLGKKDQRETWVEALDITLSKMRELAPVMEERESRVSIEARRPGIIDSLEEIREAQAAALYDDEQEHMPEPADTEAVEESETDPDDSEATEREPEAGHFIFNTSARNVNLNDESLRLPRGLTFEDRKTLVGVHMPNVDAKLEGGMAPKTILSGIDELVEEWNRNLPEDLTTKQRERTFAKNQSAGAFLKDYVTERLKDPETRALNHSEAFREAHARITEARTPDELNRAADAIRNDDRFNERDRRLLFFGRPPDHHTPEMHELRRMWWLPQTTRVKAISEGRIESTTELKELVAQLASRNSKGRVDYFFSALKNPPEKMQKPEESVRLSIWPKFQSLPPHEQAFLLNLTWEKKQSFAGKSSSLRETAPRLPDALPFRDSESLRTYLAELKDIERGLLETRQPFTDEERIAIHDKACRQAWDRLVLPEVFAERLTEEARALSDTIAELQEKIQPKARLAAQVLNEFSLQKSGHTHDRVPLAALAGLSPADIDRLDELERFAAAARDELYRGFERIDDLRREIEVSREAAQGERIPANESHREQMPPAIREQGETAGTTSPEVMEMEIQRSDLDETRSSYREYTTAVAEIERQLLDEAIRQKQPPDKGGQEKAPGDGLLNREEKLRVRTIAAGLAWERIEPREIMTNDPVARQLLSLSEAVLILRDEWQPQAREAARNLDEFIRSRNIDRAATEKTDYYYRADQIPRNEIQKLNADDRRAFAALEARASVNLRELKNGFGTIDQLRLEIERARSVAPNVNGKEQGGAKGSSKGPAPDPTQERINDRIILGDAIVAQARADAAVLDYETARDHGHTFRFDIHDESLDGNRRISVHDVHRRADARGNRTADEYGFERYDDRSAIRGQVSGADVRNHSTTLKEHAGKLGWLVGKLESEAEKAVDANQRAKRLAHEVSEKYGNRGEPIPAPFVEREVLVIALDEAVEHRFPGHAERLERLRVALAEEHGHPMRSDQEAARLAAQLFTAQTEMKAQNERAIKFDETRHLQQWEISGEKLSLVDIDRRVERLDDEAHFFGKRDLHVLPGLRRQARVEIDRLSEVRKEVIEKIGERQTELREKAIEVGKLVDTLARAFDRETALREQSGRGMPDPQFTRRELERAADNVETTRDVTALRQLSDFERRFNAYADRKERFAPAEGWGRAPARALMAAIFHRESSERLTAFSDRGERQPLLVEASDGRILIHKLVDTQSHSLIEMAARSLIETQSDRETRQGVQSAFHQYESRLQAEVEKTRAFLNTAREIASEQAAERSLRAGKDLPAPDIVLTPKQAMTLEIYAERQANPAERSRLLALARESAQSHFDAHSQTRSHEQDAARSLAPALGRGR
jgi:predicted NAD-dependent protein-ADP-ribosyltransferase YbiA (DUF1768 family)